MSVGLGRVERQVLKVLGWYHQDHKLSGYEDRPDVLSVGDIVGTIQYGYSKDWPDAPDKHALYQSVCRAVRSLEKKKLIRTSKNTNAAWEEGWGYKTVTLMEDKTKHLDTVGKNVGVNI